MFRCKIDSSYHCPKMWMPIYNKSLPCCLFFGRSLASYLSFLFCFTFFDVFVILSFWLNFQFLSLKAKGGGLLFVLLFSAFSLWSWAAAFASSFYLVLLASVSALLLLLHNPASDAAKSICPFLKGVWLALRRNISELSAMTSRYSSHYLDATFQGIFFSGNNHPIWVFAPFFPALSQKVSDVL